MNEYEQLIVNSIVIAKVIADELKEDNSYENVVRVADELKLTPSQVTQFINLYNKAQQFMLL